MLCELPNQLVILHAATYTSCMNPPYPRTTTLRTAGGRYRGKQNAKGPGDRRMYLLMRWIYPLIIGSLTGFFAFIINLSVENIAGFKFHTTNKLSESSTFVAFCFYMFCDVFLTMIATFLTTFVSPAAAGSGIPDVKVHYPCAPSYVP